MCHWMVNSNWIAVSVSGDLLYMPWWVQVLSSSESTHSECYVDHVLIWSLRKTCSLCIAKVRGSTGDPHRAPGSFLFTGRHSRPLSIKGQRNENLWSPWGREIKCLGPWAFRLIRFGMKWTLLPTVRIPEAKGCRVSRYPRTVYRASNFFLTHIFDGINLSNNCLR